MSSEELFDTFPADLSLWTPKLESSSLILQSRIEVCASIQEHVFGTSSGQLSSMCWGLFVYPFWGVLPQHGSHTAVPLYFSLEVKLCYLTWGHWSPSVALDHSSSDVAFLPSCLDAGFWLAQIFYTQVLAIRKSLYDSNFCSCAWDFWSSECCEPWLRGMDFLLNLFLICSPNLLSFSLKLLNCPCCWCCFAKDGESISSWLFLPGRSAP